MLRNVCHGLVVGNRVSYANTKSVVEKPEVAHQLQTTEDRQTAFSPFHTEHNMDETTRRRTDNLPFDNSEHGA
ncbi:hypothetical protein EVG20_g10927 [Dentipellis fragilis]|uniref:Uncharacterized protein n=1 Tax=Dentipellis fragilis TaxID=205917 RepID=A0A4Y9XMR3_9AGAM|nr:hypothetical protein EVG20_g10927 [Dentipellis fragilis]